MKFIVEVDTARMTGTDVSGVTKAVTDPEVIDKIARQYNMAGVFVAVAANPNTRADTLDYILEYMKYNKVGRRYEIYNKIAANPNSTKAILNKVIEFGRPTAKILAMQHPNYQKK